MHSNTDYINEMIDWILKYLLFIATFIFSLITKVFNIIKYKKRMSKFECVVDTTLSGLGSAIIIYILLKMNVNTWLICAMGGYSSLIVTPVSTMVSKEITPLLQLIANGIKSLVTKWFTNKSNKL